MPQEKQNPRQPVLKPAPDPKYASARKVTQPWDRDELQVFRQDAISKEEADFLSRPRAWNAGKDVNLPIERDAKGNAIKRAAIIAELGKKKK